MLTKPKGIGINVSIPQRLKWGVAGCSNVAENVFLPSLQAVKRSKLVAVYSHNLNRAQTIAQKFGALNATDDFEQFLKNNFSALYISGVNSDHYEQVIKAAEAGKHILCERPIALNSIQAKEMVEACKKNNVMLVVNHVHRFHPLIIKVKELLDNQMLGKIINISGSYNIDKVPDESFRFKKELSGGGVLRDLGSQMIDMLRYLGGEISEVKAFMDNIVYKNDVEDFSSAIVRFEKGGYGNLNVSYNTKKPFIKVDIIGYKGSISIDNFYDKKNLSTKLTIDLHGEGKKVFRKRFNKVTFMIKSVQKSFLKQQTPLVTGEDGLVNMRLIEEIEKQSS